MGYGIYIRLSGPYALFTRPEMKVERVSYDFITPSAARGALEAVYWKPAIRWVIDRIHVLKPIEFTNIRRNEVSDKILTSDIKSAMKGVTKPLYISATDRRQQRASMLLRDVDYVLEAHFEPVPAKWGERDSVEGHYAIATRRLRQGQYYHAPCLGTREFPARVEYLEDRAAIPRSTLSGSKDFGWVLYDMDYTNPDDIRPVFFRAQMVDGVIDLTKIEVRS